LSKRPRFVWPLTSKEEGVAFASFSTTNLLLRQSPSASSRMIVARFALLHKGDCARVVESSKDPKLLLSTLVGRQRACGRHLEARPHTRPHPRLPLALRVELDDNFFLHARGCLGAEDHSVWVRPVRARRHRRPELPARPGPRLKGPANMNMVLSMVYSSMRCPSLVRLKLRCGADLHLAPLLVVLVGRPRTTDALLDTTPDFVFSHHGTVCECPASASRTKQRRVRPVYEIGPTGLPRPAT
jgi:hypothetical protein